MKLNLMWEDKEIVIGTLNGIKLVEISGAVDSIDNIKRYFVHFVEDLFITLEGFAPDTYVGFRKSLSSAKKFANNKLVKHLSFIKRLGGLQ